MSLAFESITTDREEALPLAAPSAAALAPPCLDGADISKTSGTSLEFDQLRRQETARILIIDDEPINTRLMEKCLRQAGYRHVISYHDAFTAFQEINTQKPDVVLCDVYMPVSGMEILAQVLRTPELVDIPMIMVTASDDEALRHQALDAGAAELLAKPIRASELLPRVKNALLVRSHVLFWQSQSHCLEQIVQQRTAELEASRLELIHCLARLAEYRDNETGRHVVRVGRYSSLIAQQLGLDRTTVELIEQASPLHDIGKIGIPDSILLKEGKLTPEEFEFMQRHVALGKRAFEPISPGEWEVLRHHTILGDKMVNVGRSPLLAMAAQIALTHHERWDGTGYPLGLTGDEIPIAGRIVAVADVFDAVSSKRPYKPAFSIEKSFQIIEEGSGTHFDPNVVNAFKAVREGIVQCRIALADIE